jgi:XRE family aerobic/anaerobic benzoate catabolism transcriptional regulator
VAAALGLPLSRLVDEETPSPELTLLQQFLSGLSTVQVREAHAALAALFGPDATLLRTRRLALVGLRGAGKTTLGQLLAEARGVPFHELDREVERLAGATIGGILELYGQQAYRRYELQALQELLEGQPQFVVATGGGLVSEPETYELLLRHCFTVWVRATPEEHMARVLAQGDRRPMAGSERAMDDLRRILDERTPLYARADLAIDTKGTPEQAVRALLSRLG